MAGHHSCRATHLVSPARCQAKGDEVVIFSWIVYASRTHRDNVSAKVMADPRTKGTKSNMPFDGKRMIYGGFETLLIARR